MYAHDVPAHLPLPATLWREDLAIFSSFQCSLTVRHESTRIFSSKHKRYPKKTSLSHHVPRINNGEDKRVKVVGFEDHKESRMLKSIFPLWFEIRTASPSMFESPGGSPAYSSNYLFPKASHSKTIRIIDLGGAKEKIRNRRQFEKSYN